jgi:uncharacterized membrane protein
MATVIGLIVGMLAGGLVVGSGSGVLIGGVIGAFIGFIVASRRERGRNMRPDLTSQTASLPVSAAVEAALSGRVSVLERRVADLERAMRSGRREIDDIANMSPAPAMTLREATMPADVPSPVTSQPQSPATMGGAVAADARNADGTLTVLRAATPPSSDLPDPTPAVAPANPIWAWIAGGNTLARGGVVLLFIGVGFLLKYAVEHVHVPVSLRLAGVALGGVALLVIGWRLRVSRRAYAMVVQGGGVGVLYLTVFAALRLYELVSPLAAFALLVSISALSSWLAVRQDAISLAALAVAGGFLAPILTSSQSGNHVMLFSYYALLNAGILGIAWFKAWRVLNLLGFAFTFLVGTFWGVTRYQPENFATTEPFLILFFLFYVAIAVLYALRRSVEVRDYVDAGLVFGTPLVAAGLQSALMRDIEYGMAYSALAMSALYLVVGRFLHRRRRDDIRLLVESFLALGVVFATLAVPLGLDARWTAATWAVEGAAIVWAGVRLARGIVRAFGLLLQLGAGLAFLLGLSLWMPPGAAAAIPLLNSAYVGALLVSVAGCWSAWLLERHADRSPLAGPGIPACAFVWGMLWWLFAGWREIDRFVPYDNRIPVLVVFLAATAVLMVALQLRLHWPIARVPAMLLLPVLLTIAAVAIGRASLAADHLFAHGGFLGWIAAVMAVAGLLRWFDRQPESAAIGTSSAPSIELLHAGLLWLVLLLIAHELSWAGSRIAERHGVWSAVPWGLVPALGLGLVCEFAPGQSWPIGTHRRGYFVLGAAPVAVVLTGWSIAASIHGSGDPAPLPYLPLLNPLDLTQAAVLLALATWTARVRREDPPIFNGLPPDAFVGVLCALAFLWINAIALRSIHFWYDVPYTPRSLWQSTVVQAVLSLLWSSLALATMAFANRRRWRVPWIVGAVLLGIVVAKLFFVELAQVGTITRIVSFIGVGLLLLLIGYVAPVPPRKENAP